MKKAFKLLCLIMTSIIIISSFLMVFTLNGFLTKFNFDPFNSEGVIDDIKNYELNMTSVVYVKNSDGNFVEYKRIHGEENRIWVNIDNVPQNLIDAVISIEDERFYSHSGVDWKRTVSAFANLVFHFWDVEQGGSTITQQLIKNITLDNEQNAGRKIREIFRAIAVEKQIDKRTILEAYLNTISLGNGICGVQVAANYYFNKDVSDLSLIECAAIAGITKNPSAYDPVYNPENNKERRNIVLSKMLELGEISKEEYDEAYDVDLNVDPSQRSNYESEINSYFIDALIDDVSNKVAEKYNCSVDEATMKLYNGGYKIYATLDPEIQDAMESIYTDPAYFRQTSKIDGSSIQSAMTILDYEGHIVGIVGGAGEKTTNRGLNRATDSPRQPGSTMKPLGVYAPAIDSGAITATTMIEDKAINGYFGPGKPGPYEWWGGYIGFMSIPKAIEKSANTIPCWILRDSLGIDASYDFCKNKIHLNHLTDNDQNLASLALGGCEYGITTTESAAAYAIFGNQGKYYKPTTFYKIEDRRGNLIAEGTDKGEQVIKPGTATIMNGLLQNVVYGAEGTGGGIAGYNRMRAYAKTGTSNDSNDLWMVAGTPYYVGSVWYGFDHNETIYNPAAAASVWRAVMSKVHSNMKFKQFELSKDVTVMTYCTESGRLAGKDCKNLATAQYLPGLDYAYCDGNHDAFLSAKQKEEKEKKEKEEKEKKEQEEKEKREKEEKEKENSSETSSETSSNTGQENNSP